MKMRKQMVLYVIILIAVSTQAGAVEKTVFPDEIYIQKKYDGITKIVENYAKDKSVEHVQTGDLNGDGFDDVVFGSRYSNAYGLDDAGIVYIIFGNQDFFHTATYDIGNSQNILKITGNDQYDYLGRSLATGDINGDGIDDLLFGASTCLITNEPYKGNAYVLLGNAGLSSREDIDLRNPPADIIVITGDYEIGSSVSLGDIDSDGFDDIILGAAVDWGTGSTYVIQGSADFSQYETIDLSVDTAGIIKTASGSSNDCFGIYTASGDINGDGFDEVIIGARQASSNAREHCGKTFVIWGYTGFFTQEPSIDLSALGQNITTIYGADAYDYSGTVIETGNLDNDTYDELILESSRHNSGRKPYAGIIYILKGNPAISDMAELDLGASQPNLIKIYGSRENEYLGRCFLFDANNDGTNDIVLNSQGYNESGETYILTDETLWSENVIDLAEIQSGIIKIYGNQPAGILGFELRSCDIDGNGANDLILGSHDMPWASYYTDGVAYIMSGAGVTEIPYEPYKVYATDTGSSSTVIILDEHPPLLNGMPLNYGSEIAVFTQSGICTGVGTWNGDDLEITVWGDNPDTDDVEGFVDGGRYCFLTRDRSDDIEYDGEASVYSGDLVYHDGDIVVISSLRFGVINDVAESGPESFRLGQNYPNPFNPVTTIPFAIAEIGHVRLDIYDIRGGAVATLADNVFSPGAYALEWNAAGYPSGVYLYRLETESLVETKKMLLIK